MITQRHATKQNEETGKPPTAFIHQTLTESWDEYQSAPIDKFPARSYELLFAAVKDIARYLEGN